jgi:NMD protein affecting ribosome stability and mRNA decay
MDFGQYSQEQVLNKLKPKKASCFRCGRSGTVNFAGLCSPCMKKQYSGVFKKK